MLCKALAHGLLMRLLDAALKTKPLVFGGCVMTPGYDRRPSIGRIKRVPGGIWVEYWDIRGGPILIAHPGGVIEFRRRAEALPIG
jgi:hypothetical protein